MLLYNKTQSHNESQTYLNLSALAGKDLRTCGEEIPHLRGNSALAGKRFRTCGEEIPHLRGNPAFARQLLRTCGEIPHLRGRISALAGKDLRTCGEGSPHLRGKKWHLSHLFAKDPIYS
jgi:hypothetical protein